MNVSTQKRSHNHITQRDTKGCPACDWREGRTTHLTEPIEFEVHEVPDSVRAMPHATHRLVDERAVCDGDHGSKCHWYPDTDTCTHESWPCGCEYVAHDECWVIVWLDAMDLYDTASEESAAMRNDDLEWPDGLIEWEWMGECVVWWYAAEKGSDL